MLFAGIEPTTLPYRDDTLTNGIFRLILAQTKAALYFVQLFGHQESEVGLIKAQSNRVSICMTLSSDHELCLRTSVEGGALG